MTTLVDKFITVVAPQYVSGDWYKDIIAALQLLDQVNAAREHDSLASDGWEMIESVIVDMEREKSEEVRPDEARDEGTDTGEA